MLETGYIKLHRSILSWEWYGDTITTCVFLHLLLTSNIKDDRWQGVDVPRGSRVCTYPKLAEELKITIQQSRTAIAHLKLTGEITVKRYSKFSVISITNWDKFQGGQQSTNRASNSQSTVKRSPNQQQNKNIKNKEDKIDTKKVSILSGEERSVYREIGADDWD